MRDEISNIVYPVLSRGLALKERLDRGDRPDLEEEQAKLKGLLNPESEGRRAVDYVGEMTLDRSVMVSGTISRSQRGGEQYLGIRYALVCWLDEMFVNSTWEKAWNERKLETSLYGTNDRSFRFWEQARKAESRSNSDALEAYFLCVMLGFRGEYREQSEKLTTWVNANQERIGKGQGQEWSMPGELEPPVFVPPLRGREKLQRMMFVAGVATLIAIPSIVLLVSKIMKQQ